MFNLLLVLNQKQIYNKIDLVRIYDKVYKKTSF